MPVATSQVTERARALVADRREAALALGREAGDLAGDPVLVVARICEGLPALADPEYHEGQHVIAPGLGSTFGVRQPLLTQITAGLRAATRRDPPSTLLAIAERLLREDRHEPRWLALPLLERVITRDPERAWQLVRATARTAADWITVDSLAHVAAEGILAEPFRWAELEQLVYSPSRWERRLVGSTLATIPYQDRTTGRTLEVARRGIAIVGELIGDSEPDVQKALSWALRSLTIVDAPAVIAFLEHEAATAAATADGHRAWVVRDALERLPEPVAASIRATVDGIRKRPHASSTSHAAEAAAAFAGLGVGVPPAERPTVPRP